MAAPIVQGVGKIAKNIIFGKGITVRTVDVKKIDASFNDSKVFVAEIKSKFPKNYAKIHKLRQDLKVYQFDLKNIINDVALMADSTTNDVDKTVKSLGLRTRL